jgi:hypothetical protein
MPQSVECAHCGAQILVPQAPRVEGGYFLLPRRCRSCTHANTLEVQGASVRVTEGPRRREAITQKIVIT